MNRIIEDSLANYFLYTNMYNSGGVAVGDLDGDSLPDLVMVSNRNAGAVYKNLGGMRFEDITSRVGFDLSGTWATGVTLVDVDADGRLDIHVSASGPWPGHSRRNLLFMNKGADRFAEEGDARGLAIDGQTTMAYFADLDGDGDLDAYLVQHRNDWHDMSRVVIDPQRPYDPIVSDRLLLNNGKGHFTDQTQAAGVAGRNFGLAACIGDLNDDGRPDIYVCNDFSTADRMLIQQPGQGRDGKPRFSDQILTRLKHTSYYSMGIDRADINNDGLQDLCVLDMTPGDHKRNKENMASMQPEAFWNLVRTGFHHQYMVNVLQLNNGNGTYSDIGHLAGIDRTDWSWAPLFLDLDNDGWKDLFVSNGIARDIANSDFRAQVHKIAREQGTNLYFRPILELAPRSVVNNLVYRNQGDLTFGNAVNLWSYRHAANTTGAAYADLDADGDLDLVTMDVDQTAKVIRNHARENGTGHFLQIKLKGEQREPTAMGTVVTLHAPGGSQVAELRVERGFQSSVEPLIHFGLGSTTIDSLTIDWPDGTRSTLHDPGADQRLWLHWDQLERMPIPAPQLAPPLLTERHPRAGIDHRHAENAADDLLGGVLLPHRQTEHGPAAAVADVNGDGLDDVLITASAGRSCTLFLQQSDERLLPATHQPWSAFSNSEFIGAHFFDADGNGTLDLYLASGSTEFPVGSPLYQDRIFLNDGKGRFRYADGALPPITSSTQAIASADIDGDGDIDLFIGGRNIPGAYPAPPPSLVLLNEGGRFMDATTNWLGDIQLGMVTSALFVDLDGDGPKELVVCGEWMPVMAFRSEGNRFIDATAQLLDPGMTGWWFTITAADLDGDGDVDLVTGNLGLNNKFHPSAERPLKVYMSDFEGKGRNEVVLAKTTGSTELPIRGRECSSQQCPSIAQRFPTYKAFAEADLTGIYGQENLARAVQAQATEFRSMVWRNNGLGKLTPEPLPNQAQISPLRGIVVMDVDGDGRLDLVTAGNMYGAEVETTRYDAGIGLVLTSAADGQYTARPVLESGFHVPFDSRALVILRTGRPQPSILVVNNSGPVQLFDLRQAPLPTGMAQR
ncbi:MAG: VCBS repeat-containing protein [Flavobacteriales bacterium]|nr:VCBS repeat-containing protein [Flavobacteriales bacterium]